MLQIKIENIYDICSKYDNISVLNNIYNIYLIFVYIKLTLISHCSIITY